jgi:glycosyltransferase involved in cell wall biosynthesis
VIGGVETVLAAQARLFADHGYPVKVIVGRGRQFDKRVRLVRLPWLDSTYRENLKLNAQAKQGAAPAGYEEYKNRIARTLGRALSRVEVVIIHNMLVKALNFASTQALWEIVARDRKGRRYINWVHDLDACAEGAPRMMRTSKDFPWYLINRPVPGVLNVTVSRARQKQLARLYRLPTREIRVVPNTVEPAGFLGLSPAIRELWEEYKLWEADLVILMPCRIVPKKNLERALEVARALKNLHRRVRLIVAGPPSRHLGSGGKTYLEGVKRLARDLSLAPDVLFLYQLENAADRKRLGVSNAMMRDLYLLSDLIFVPSRDEGFGIPLLEAALAGTPVACANLPALRELGGREALFLNPELSSTQWARKIARFVNELPTYRFYKRVVRGYTGRVIFKKFIEPLVS